MGELLIVRGFIPQTNRRTEISGISSIGRRAASIAATLAITVGVTGPLPTAPIDLRDGLHISNSVELPLHTTISQAPKK